MATTQSLVDATATVLEREPRAPGCRFCGSPLRHTFVDLGLAPLCQSHVEPDQLDQMEPFYPLHAYVCGECFLVQLRQHVSPETIFSEYAYFSSYADTWLRHAQAYTEFMIERFGLGPRSQVIEVASNDGYLLQYFVAQGIPAFGIEPAANVARVAAERGIPTLVKFFGEGLARELVAQGKRADLLVGNNVLAHVPDLNGFVEGLRLLLQPQGVLTLEFPHLLRLMEGKQFDTIYHEHFSYFSFLTVERVFAAHGLTLFDVEELPTHGGSLRIYGRHADDPSKPVSRRVRELRMREEALRCASLETYVSFAATVQEAKRELLACLIRAKREGKSIAGYGAPGKGCTLLNYCGIRSDFLDYTVDRNPYKQGRFTPGTRIPIHHPDRIRQTKPDYLLILPWNLKDEIMQQMACIRDWGGRFIVPIPDVQVYP